MKQKGFSLLELIIYVAVLSVVAMIVAGIFISLNKGGGQNEARSEVNSAIRFSLERISQDLKSATSTSIISDPSGTTTASVILTFSAGPDTISYSTTTDNRLQRSLNGSPETLTSDKVEIIFLKFVRLENKNNVLNKTFTSIQTEISGRYKSENPDWQYSESKKTTISLR